jgi:hypothetical protein
MLRNNRERIKIKQYFIFIATKKEKKKFSLKELKRGKKSEDLFCTSCVRSDRCASWEHWPTTDKDRLTKPNSHPSSNDSTQHVYGPVFIKKNPTEQKKNKFKFQSEIINRPVHLLVIDLLNAEKKKEKKSI